MTTTPTPSRPAGEAPAASRQALETQTGSASFISKGFQGKKTASGDTYDQAQLVAAHASYPLGTIVRVVNLENDRAVEVRVIDRSAGRDHIIDLSRAAAEQLGFTEDGKVRVRTEVIEWGGVRGKQ